MKIWIAGLRFTVWLNELCQNKLFDVQINDDKKIDFMIKFLSNWTSDRFIDRTDQVSFEKRPSESRS